MKAILVAPLLVVALNLTAREAGAQTSSLVHRPIETDLDIPLTVPRAVGVPAAALRPVRAGQPAPSVSQLSLIRAPEPRPFQVHDLISIVVTEESVHQTNARSNRRKTNENQLSFNDTIVLLSGFRIRADQAIRNETPGVDVESENTINNQIQFVRTDLLTFSVQAEVVEVRPNGNLVIEAHQIVEVDNEVKRYELSGIVSPADIDPLTRTVSSAVVAKKRVLVHFLGPTRDAYRRGWFQRVIDMFSFF